MRDRTILCFSLANLCFISGWIDLFRFVASAPEQVRSPAAWALFGGTCSSVIVLGAILLFGTYLARGIKNPFLKKLEDCFFLFAMSTALDWLTWQVVCWGIQEGSHKAILYFLWASIVIFIPLTGSLLILLYNNRVFVKGCSIFLRLAAFLPVVSIISFLLAVVSAHQSTDFLVEATLENPEPKSRVVWMVFDEWDQYLMFDGRPKDVCVPEIDRLINESIYCTRAQAPAWDTPESIASLIVGRRVEKFGLHSSGDSKILQFADGDMVSVKNASTLFLELRKVGMRSGLAGWHLPYCDLLASHLSECFCPSLADVKPVKISEVSISQLKDQLRLHWLPSIFGQALFARNPAVVASLGGMQEWIKAHILLSERASTLVKDPSLGLVFLHWNLPHPPGIWNRETDEFTVDFSSNYFDNFELLDRIIGQVRKDLVEANLERRTSIIITSDHPFRPDYWSKNTTWSSEETTLTQGRRSPYIPFIVKVAGDNNAIRIDDPFNTIITGRIVLKLLGSQIETNRSVCSMLLQETAAETP